MFGVRALGSDGEAASVPPALSASPGGYKTSTVHWERDKGRKPLERERKGFGGASGLRKC